VIVILFFGGGQYIGPDLISYLINIDQYLAETVNNVSELIKAFRRSRYPYLSGKLWEE
jgi:hypothetical protein